MAWVIDADFADIQEAHEGKREQHGDVHRHSHGEILHKRGTFRLVKQPPPESLTAGIVDRLAALFDSVQH